jgi:glycosyltransferase involved in cell wall biosynthesis
VSEKDRGQTHAINKGMKKATGDVVAYLNSDDVYLPNTLQTVGEYFAGHPDAGWLTGDYFIIDADGRKIQSYVTWYKRLLRRTPTFNKLAVANYIIQPSTFWRQSLNKRTGQFDENLRYCMDYDYWLRLLQHQPPAVSDRHFSLFRIHGQSKGGALYAKQFAEEHQVLKKYSNNPLILALHKLHAWGIVIAYKLIK